MKISKEAKIGAMVLIAIAAIVLGYGFMKGQHVFDSSKQIYAVYDDVEGLSKSSDIMINGLRVGTVSDITFLDQAGKILVTMRVKSDFEFGNNSIAEIYSEGLIGGKILKIHPDYRSETVRSGDTLQSKLETSMMGKVTERLEPLVQEFQGMVRQIDSLARNFNDVMDDSGKKNIKESLENLNSTLAHLNSSSAQVDNLLANNTDKLDNTFTNLNQFSDSLAKVEIQPMITQIEKTIEEFNEVSHKLNEGDGTAAKLLNDGAVYDNLDHASRQLEELLQDVKLNPKRYINVKFSIFGGKNRIDSYERPTDRSD